MPSIVTASNPVTVFPNLFVSPFGNDGIIPLYSSIPIASQLNQDCLPCVVCANSNQRNAVIAQEATALSATIPTGTEIAVGT